MLRYLLATTMIASAATAVEARDIDEIGHDLVRMETCLAAALEVRPGEVRKLEFKSEEGTPIYEFDMLTDDGVLWNIECDATTGLVSEMEREVAADDPLFTDYAEVSEDDARAKILQVYPGSEIEAHEYVIEQNGTAAYEFDVVVPYGTPPLGREMKVEVDAKTGEITESNFELWEIGAE